MTPRWWNWPLSVYGSAVVARKLGLGTEPPDRVFEAAVRGFQRVAGIPVHGEVDIVTARALGEEANLAPPEWWEDGMDRGVLLARFDLDEDGLRRIEGQYGIRPGGGEPVELARILERRV